MTWLSLVGNNECLGQIIEISNDLSVIEDFKYKETNEE